MERTIRWYWITQILRKRKVVPIGYFLQEFSVSRSTFKRDMDDLREQTRAPIVWDKSARGYRFDEKEGEPKFELPGVWFSPPEILALLTMEHLIEQVEPGLLSHHIESLRESLASMLERGDHSAKEVRNRVRITSIASRKRDLRCFQTIGFALLKRKRVRIKHYNRERDETTEREVSPQRLVYYRQNWLLDAWCHQSRGIRSFGVEVLRGAEMLDQTARDVSDAELDAHFKGGYGIFSGKVKAWAKLKFTPLRARWVATELWHEQQRSRFERDGSYILEVPYSDDRELSMDIMRFGPDCEVLEPPALREKVATLHVAAAARYGAGGAAHK